jgi:hypothetical protein
MIFSLAFPPGVAYSSRWPPEKGDPPDEELMDKANAQPREKTTLVIADGTAMGCELLRNQLSSPKYSIKVVASAVDQAGTLEVAAKH